MTADWHIGRSFADTHLEDACPCPQEPCGLIARDQVRPDCPEHAVWAGKSIRQGHRPDACVGPPVTQGFRSSSLTVEHDEALFIRSMNAYRNRILSQAEQVISREVDRQEWSDAYTDGLAAALALVAELRTDTEDGEDTR